MRQFSYLISQLGRLKIYDGRITKCVYYKKFFNNELNALFRLNHKYIIKYNLVNIDSSIFEFPYYEKGDLIEYLKRKNRTVGIKETHTDYVNKIKPLCKKIALAIEHCHSKQVIHCDIKPDNIVLDNSFNPILIDFGHAFLLDQDVFDGVMIGTSGYSSPELRQGKIGYYNDVYSLGVVFHTLFYHKLPFMLPCKNIDIDNSYYQRQVPYDIENLIINMLDPIYENRPTIQEVLDTPVMKEVILEE